MGIHVEFHGGRLCVWNHQGFPTQRVCSLSSKGWENWGIIMDPNTNRFPKDPQAKISHKIHFYMKSLTTETRHTLSFWRIYFVFSRKLPPPKPCPAEDLYLQSTKGWFLEKEKTLCHHGTKATSSNLDMPVGGFNPAEKYWSKWESSPNRGEHYINKYLKPPPSMYL